MPVGIVGVGGFVPSTIITNRQVAEWTGRTEEWIVERTGILERRYASPVNEPTSALAHRAVRDLLKSYPDALRGLGLIKLATSTPDKPIPATASILQGLLGLGWPVPAWDTNAVCSGSLVAIVEGAAMLTAGAGGSAVLVVGADKYSTIMDQSDPRTVSLFGDGAGAVLLEEVPDGYGIHGSVLVTHGEHAGYVQVRGGGSAYPLDADALALGEDRFRMDGRKVKDYVMATLPDMLRSIVAKAKWSLDDVDRFVFHQANPKLLGMVGEELGIDPGRVPLTGTHYGNTGAASVLVTLWHSHRDRPLQRGEKIVFGAVGGGMNAAAIAMTWY